MALVVCAAFAPCAAVAAQTAPPLQVEGRVDVFTVDPMSVQTGLGITAPLGTYVRFGVVGGIGASAGAETSGRVDVIARFTLDPFREKRWAPYAVGGVSSRFGRSSGNYLVLLAGLEGPPLRRGLPLLPGDFAPAVELGAGGGFRVGVVLRQAFARRR